MRVTTRNLIVAIAVMQAGMTVSSLYIAWRVKEILRCHSRRAHQCDDRTKEAMECRLAPVG
jgi:hypothetical protein